MTIKRLVSAIVLCAVLFGAVASPAFAAPGDNGEGVGGCVDNLYGNATNPRPSGNGVLPSESPGPWEHTGFNEPPRNDREDGLSVGEVMQIGTASGSNGHEIMEVICEFP
jgi:hypothetical protein